VTAIPMSERDLDRVRNHLVDLGAGALNLYKGACFERRVASRIRVHRLPSVKAYADLLDRDPEERSRLLSAIAIGVTSFFRNPPAWRRLAELIGPTRAGERFTAWSAGCASGEEAFSAAILLAGLARAGRIGEWSVTATDVDERGLTVARTGRYPARAAAEIEAARLGSGGGIAGGQFEVDPSIRSRVLFRREDLLGHGARFPCDLVVCRNVLIYFGAEGQERAIRNLVDGVRPGGLLMLGKAELVTLAAELPLDIVDRRERIYRRVG